MSGEHPFHPQPGSNMCVCGRPVAHIAHHPPLDRIIRDRDEWNEHLANEGLGVETDDSMAVVGVPGGQYPVGPCPDCTDGKIDMARLLAVGAAVFKTYGVNDFGAEAWGHVKEFIETLRQVRP